MTEKDFLEKRKQLLCQLCGEAWEGKEIWKYIRDEELSATPAFEGELYQQANTKIMFVGRALNGWDEPLGDCSTLENVAEAVCDQPGALDTLVNEDGYRSAESIRVYKHVHSKFFRFIKKTLELFGESDEGTTETWYRDSKQWNQKFVWANLFCIAPRRPKPNTDGNPKASLKRLGIAAYVELMKLYIEYYRPDLVVFITDINGWFAPWTKTVRNSFKDMLDTYKENSDQETIRAEGTLGKSKIFVVKRPDRRGKSYADVEQMAKELVDRFHEDK